MLVVLSGLPGTGKTTIAQMLADRLSAVYLRIGTIEQAIRDAGVLTEDVGPAGYMVAYALAEANLKLGHMVIADSVNPLAITRSSWRAVAERAGKRVIEAELICSDRVEHRRRVEERKADIAGLRLPSWNDVCRREYQPWATSRLVIDTYFSSPGETCERICVEFYSQQINAPDHRSQ